MPMQPTPADLVLFSLAELQRLKMVEETPFDKRVVFDPATDLYPRRPINLPASACQLVEERIEAILGITFQLRLGMSVASEMDFLLEAAQIIDCMASEDHGRINADIIAVAGTLSLEPTPLYVALAVYAKFVAIKRNDPPLLRREDIDQEVHFVYTP